MTPLPQPGLLVGRSAESFMKIKKKPQRLICHLFEASEK